MAEKIVAPRNNDTELLVTLRELEALKHPLAQKFYKAHGHNNKTNRHDQIFVCQDQSGIIGCLRIAPCDKERLLRGVLIAPSVQGIGLGSKLIEHALNQSLFDTIWTFPYTHLRDFYTRLGFIEKIIDQTPSTIKSALLSYQKQGRNICVMAWQRKTKH